VSASSEQHLEVPGPLALTRLASLAAGPPWILGHRGAPREAPENTLASLRRAVELGLDGVEYDLRACATGEAVLIHDERLERTTDGVGEVGERTLPELFALDAGVWFGRSFRGEPLGLLDEALELADEHRAQAGDGARAVRQMIELKERDLVPSIERSLASMPELAGRLARRELVFASFDRACVLELRAARLPTMLLALHPSEEDRRFVRDERIDAYGLGPDGWSRVDPAADWSFCERWAWSVDRPRDLLAACRGLHAFNTNDPWRALAIRALCRLAPGLEEYPLEVPALEVAPEALGSETRARGEWFGDWRTSVRVRNPFAFGVRITADVFVRSGAFELEGLPAHAELPPAGSVELPFRLAGGARGPGDDALIAVRFQWRAEDSPVPGLTELLLDAPLERVRSVHASGTSARLVLLRERADDPAASIALRLHHDQLTLSLETAGDLEDPHLVAHLDGEILRGGRGLRLRLPRDFEHRAGGVPFSAGIEGRRAGAYTLRRWSGGLPEGLGHGRPGALFAGERG